MQSDDVQETVPVTVPETVHGVQTPGYILPFHGCNTSMHAQVSLGKPYLLSCTVEKITMCLGGCYLR